MKGCEVERLQSRPIHSGGVSPMYEEDPSDIPGPARAGGTTARLRSSSRCSDRHMQRSLFDEVSRIRLCTVCAQDLRHGCIAEPCNHMERSLILGIDRINPRRRMHESTRDSNAATSDSIEEWGDAIGIFSVNINKLGPSITKRKETFDLCDAARKRSMPQRACEDAMNPTHF